MKTDILDKNVIKSFAKGSKEELKQGGRAVIYQRVSSKEQEDGFSPETQKECCYNWAERHGYVVVKCFEGEHESAKSDTKRKRFNQMLKFVRDKKNKIDAVIVYSTSRFSRTGSFSVVEELKKRNITVFSATSSYDARTATGEYMQGVELLNARHDNRIKGQAVKDNGAKALRSGRWIQHAPKGYDMNTTKTQQIITVNSVGRLIAQAFEMKIKENLTNEEIRVRMKNLGLDLKKQQWSKIFSNIFYAGYFSHSFLEGELVKGPHEPLVSLDDFLGINGMLIKAHNRGYEVKLEKEYAPLLGTIKCPICGGNLTASLSTKMRKKYGKDVGYYVCSRKGCKYNASTLRVNSKFADFIDGVSLPDSFDEILRTQLKKAFPILNKDRMNEMKILRTNLAKINKDLEKIEENYSIASTAKEKEICMKQYTKKEAERDEILAVLDEADGSILNLEKYVGYGMNIKDNLLKLWQIANLGNKKRIQDMMFFNGIIYNKENDDIEPLSKNEFMFLFGLESMSCGDKKRNKPSENDDLSSLVLEAGLLNIHFFTPCYILIMLYINVLSKCEFSLNVVKSNRNTEMFM